MRRRFTKEESVFEKKKRGEVTTNLVKVKEEVVGLVLSDDERGGSNGGGGALLLSLLTFDFEKFEKLSIKIYYYVLRSEISLNLEYTRSGENLLLLSTLFFTLAIEIWLYCQRSFTTK